MRFFTLVAVSLAISVFRCVESFPGGSTTDGFRGSKYALGSASKPRATAVTYFTSFCDYQAEALTLVNASLGPVALSQASCNLGAQLAVTLLPPGVAPAGSSLKLYALQQCAQDMEVLMVHAAGTDAWLGSGIGPRFKEIMAAPHITYVMPDLYHPENTYYGTNLIQVPFTAASERPRGAGYWQKARLTWQRANGGYKAVMCRSRGAEVYGSLVDLEAEASAGSCPYSGVLPLSPERLNQMISAGLLGQEEISEVTEDSVDPSCQGFDLRSGTFGVVTTPGVTANGRGSAGSYGWNNNMGEWMCAPPVAAGMCPRRDPTTWWASCATYTSWAGPKPYTGAGPAGLPDDTYPLVCSAALPVQAWARYAAGLANATNMTGCGKAGPWPADWSRSLLPDMTHLGRMYTPLGPLAEPQPDWCDTLFNDWYGPFVANNASSCLTALNHFAGGGAKALAKFDYTGGGNPELVCSTLTQVPRKSTLLAPISGTAGSYGGAQGGPVGVEPLAWGSPTPTPAPTTARPTARPRTNAPPSGVTARPTSGAPAAMTSAAPAVATSAAPTSAAPVAATTAAPAAATSAAPAAAVTAAPAVSTASPAAVSATTTAPAAASAAPTTARPPSRAPNTPAPAQLRVAPETFPIDPPAPPGGLTLNEESLVLTYVTEVGWDTYMPDTDRVREFLQTDVAQKTGFSVNIIRIVAFGSDEVLGRLTGTERRQALESTAANLNIVVGVRTSLSAGDGELVRPKQVSLSDAIQRVRDNRDTSFVGNLLREKGFDCTDTPMAYIETRLAKPQVGTTPGMGYDLDKFNRTGQLSYESIGRFNWGPMTCSAYQMCQVGNLPGAPVWDGTCLTGFDTKPFLGYQGIPFGDAWTWGESGPNPPGGPDPNEIERRRPCVYDLLGQPHAGGVRINISNAPCLLATNVSYEHWPQPYVDSNGVAVMHLWDSNLTFANGLVDYKESGGDNILTCCSWSFRISDVPTI